MSSKNKKTLMHRGSRQIKKTGSTIVTIAILLIGLCGLSWMAVYGSITLISLSFDFVFPQDIAVTCSNIITVLVAICAWKSVFKTSIYQKKLKIHVKKCKR